MSISAKTELERELRPAGLAGITLVAGGGHYLRRDNGVWEYAASGEPVPGARDETLAERYAALERREVAGRTCVLVDRDWAQGRETRLELTWCADVALSLDIDPLLGTKQSVLAVPSAEFTARGDVIVGLDAPELRPQDMVSPAQLAHLLGVERVTIAAYQSRGTLPGPVFQIGGPKQRTPLWSRPVIAHWSRQRRSNRPD